MASMKYLVSETFKGEQSMLDSLEKFAMQ